MTKTIKIQGMICNKCVEKVKRYLFEIVGVELVKIDFENNSALVSTQQYIPNEIFTEEIKYAGFDVLQIK